MPPKDDTLAAWAASGAMALTGRADGPPLPPPSGFVARVRALERAQARVSAHVGRPVAADGLALLGERAALAGLGRAGAISCGGGTRLLRTTDGWLAVSLARPSDLDLLSAWLEIEAPTSLMPPGPGWASGATAELSTTMSAQPPHDPGAAHVWEWVADQVRAGTAKPLAARAQLLGLPVSALPGEPVAAPIGPPPFGGLPLRATLVRRRVEAPLGGRVSGSAAAGGADWRSGIEGLLVVDLSSLWAGPLCAQLLGLAGARIVKVESTGRPDGARSGPPAFYDLLHAGHESVALDFGSDEGRAQLFQLLRAADVVIEASRPRALQQLGIDAESLVAVGGPRVWLAITGYGRTSEHGGGVAFGDDAAAAGGLVAWDEAGPCFLADAVADPTTGLVAAVAALTAVADGGRWLLDVSLQGVAAHFAAGALPGADRAGSRNGLVVAPPSARPVVGRAAPLGAHTAAVLAEIAGRRA